MKNRDVNDVYCEDCAFYNRTIRPGCSAPQNLKNKSYPNRVTRRTGDPQKQRWTDIERMRSYGRLFSKLFRVCGVDAQWFSSASASEISVRKPIQMKRS